nr:putative nucleotidyltransferase, ribonuclease H [Tanacetum cinerariifolium]
KSTCFVRDLQGNDLLIGNRRSDLYTISLQESTSSTPLCPMAKASPTQAWLWHRRLSHFNFGYINMLSKKDIMIALAKLKYVKDQLCSNPQDKQPTTNVQPTSAPSILTYVHAEENNNDQAEEDHLPDDEFTNPFYHPLEQVHGNPSRLVQTRRQLVTNPKMCMFALTVSTAEPKNIKEAMANSAWIEAMQEELHQFDRLRVWELIDKPFGKAIIRLKWLWKNKKRMKTKLKALYRLKQAPRAWYNKLSKFLTSIGFTKGLQIRQSPRGIFINQAKYALKIFHKHGMDKGQSIGTPMATKPKLDADLSGNLVDQTDYSSKIGSLMLAEIFQQEIIRLHGTLSAIISDRDPRFASCFWKGLQKAWGTRLKFSTAFHPQTDGQSERTIQTLEDMLRSCALEWTGNWDDYICLDQVRERVIEGPKMIKVTNKKVSVAKEKLKEARTRQKSYADKHRRSLEFQPGDHVFLKVSPARGVRRFGIKGKLSPRFIGPFEILDRVGEVSYHLALPPQLSHVHNVFHVSLLRGYKYYPLHVISVMRKKTIPFIKILWRNHPEREALKKPRSLSGLLILISFHDLIVEWHDYKHLDWITVHRDDDKLYQFKEGDFKRLRIQDIEDMLLLLVQGKLTNLTVEERFAFNVSLRMFTRSIVIQHRVEDL